MAKPELGLKRQCMSCGAKFYDLSRDPAVCPKCGTVFQMAAVGHSRVAAPVLAKREEEDEPETETEGAEVVSLEDVEAEENAADDSNDDDEETTESSSDDTFLEEEEGNDDVSDLIDGDIENDEEG